MKSGNEGVGSGKEGEGGGVVSVEESSADASVKRAVESVDRTWIVTQARDGQILFPNNKKASHIPGQPRV